MTRQEIEEILTKEGKTFACDVIVRLMDRGVLDITDINTCYTRHLQGTISELKETINQADNCIFESLFTDSIGKPSDNGQIMRKIKWIEKVGLHNVEGIMDYFKKNAKKK